MASTAENPSPFDPLGRMPADEPRFVLRGTDAAAPSAITEWARVTRNIAIRQYGIEPKRKSDREALEAVKLKCTAAEQQAFDMNDWRLGHGEAENVRATYSGETQTAEQLADLKAKNRIDGLLQQIQEGRFQICEAKEGLKALDLISEEMAAEFQYFLDRAQKIAEHLDPRSAYREPQLPIMKVD